MSTIWQNLRKAGSYMVECWPYSTQIVLLLVFYAVCHFFVGWKTSVVIVISIYMHELGHWFAMRHVGLKTKGIFFIPLIGAITIGEARRIPHAHSVFVFLAGPFAGLLCASMCVVAHIITGDKFWGTAAALNAGLNLFNLFPIIPLDGGHVSIRVATAFDEDWVSTGSIVFSVVAILAGFAWGLKSYPHIQVLCVVLGCRKIRQTMRALPGYLKRLECEIDHHEHTIQYLMKEKQDVEKILQDPGFVDYCNYKRNFLESYSQTTVKIQQEIAENKEQMRMIRMPRKDAYIWGGLYLVTVTLLGGLAYVY